MIFGVLVVTLQCSFIRNDRNFGSVLLGARLFLASTVQKNFTESFFEVESLKFHWQVSC